MWTSSVVHTFNAPLWRAAHPGLQAIVGLLPAVLLQSRTVETTALDVHASGVETTPEAYKSTEPGVGTTPVSLQSSQRRNNAALTSTPWCRNNTRAYSTRRLSKQQSALQSRPSKQRSGLPAYCTTSWVKDGCTPAVRNRRLAFMANLLRSHLLSAGARPRSRLHGRLLSGNRHAIRMAPGDRIESVSAIARPSLQRADMCHVLHARSGLLGRPCAAAYAAEVIVGSFGTLLHW